MLLKVVTSLNQVLKRKCIEFECVVILKGRKGEKGHKLGRLMKLQGTISQFCRCHPCMLPFNFTMQ